MKNSQTLLKVEGLSKKYCRDLKKSLMYGVRDVLSEVLIQDHEVTTLREKEFWVLQDIDFELRRGETLGLLGHNGAGKSTLLKLLNGLIKPTRGSVTVSGRMQALIELGGAFNPLLSGRENIFISAAILGIGKRAISKHLEEIIEFSELAEFIDAPVGTYSTGMKVRLGFSVAMFINPDILILDEVLSVGDTSFQNKSLERIAQIREKAGGVIFVSHNIYQIRKLCTKCIVLDHGKILGYGEPEAMIDLYIKHSNRVSPDRNQTTQGLELSGGMTLESFRLINALGQESNEFDGGPFTLNIRIDIQTPTDDVGLDIGLFTSAKQSLINISRPVKELSKTTGSKVLKIEFPELNLSGGHYFFYLSIRDQRSTRKIIKFMDPLGFTITTPTYSVSILEPKIHVEVSQSFA